MEIKLLGINNKEYIESQIQILAAAGKLSRFKGNVTEVLETCTDYDKNINFIKRVVGMGHESITDHDYLLFSLVDVSPIIEQTIIEERLCSFTIKSRREVDFSNVGYRQQTFKDKSGTLVLNQEYYQDKYNRHMQFLFTWYGKLLEMGISKEDARFILPYSYYSNIIMGIDAHIYKNLIIRFTKGKESRIDELREFGEELLRIAKVRTPYLLDLIDKAEPSNQVENLINSKITDYSYGIVPKVNLLSNTPDVDQTIFTSYLMQKYQYSYEQALAVYHDIIRKNLGIEEIWMREINNAEDKECLTSVNFRFQIPVSLAVLTHLSRHRTHHFLVPDFVPVHNLTDYKTPVSIKNTCLEEYNEIFRKNEELYQEFKVAGIRDEDLIYFHLSGTMVNVVTNMNGKDVEWILHLRECTKAQWEIREIAHQIHQEITKTAQYFPLILGPTCVTKGYCPEGKESCGRILKLKVDQNPLIKA